jgi:hypothetical protein
MCDVCTGTRRGGARTPNATPPLSYPRTSCTRCTPTQAVSRVCLLQTRSVYVSLLVLSLSAYCQPGLSMSSAACAACKSVASAPLSAPSLPPFSVLTGRSLLRGLAGQVRSYCDSINNFSGQSLTKLYAVKGLQDKSLPAAGF